MKLLLLLSLVLTSVSAWANHEPPHIDLDFSSAEYQKLLSKQVQTQNLTLQKTPINVALKAGKRLLSWLELINAERPDNAKIQLTSKDNRVGVPITDPNRYGPATIKSRLAKIQAELPKQMNDILFSGSELTANLEIDDKVFVKQGRLVDRLYQTAARWTLLKPYKGIYTQRQAQDVRGYYYLSTNNWTAERISQEWDQLDQEALSKLKTGLAGICVNSGPSFKNCMLKVERLKNGSEASSHYSQYIRRSQSTWDRFFEIRNARRDIKWKGAAATEAKIPFFDPKTDDVRAFIKDNIEDEFKWNDWGLKIDFVNKKPAPYVQFIPGQTANVNGLGGNRIQMDANKSLNEYEEQWIIRHEFGHVLGIPDCYHEFYVPEENVFINYQIDTTDLMCSRAGDMNERIYLQLKEAYAK